MSDKQPKISSRDLSRPSAEKSGDSLVETLSDNAMKVLEMPSRQVRVWHNRIVAFASKHHLNVITFGLLLCSVFFFASVQPQRYRALSNNPELFANGQTVTITRIIDGDELRIENAAGSTRLRLLGIQSFDASANDLTVSEFGKVCVDFLETNYVGAVGRLEISPKGIDDEGRLLGSLFIEQPDGGDELDLALDLVSKGLTLVYLRYSFSRLEEYQSVQQQTRQAGLGLWASDRVSARAESMLNLWAQQRRRDERKEQAP